MFVPCFIASYHGGGTRRRGTIRSAAAAAKRGLAGDGCQLPLL